MSDTEQHIGKLEKVYSDLSDLEERCQEVCLREKWDKERYHGSWKACLRDAGFERYVILGETVYRVTKHQELDGSDNILIAERNPDGTISFNLRFYNGGCSFNEAMEAAYKTMQP